MTEKIKNSLRAIRRANEQRDQAYANYEKATNKFDKLRLWEEFSIKAKEAREIEAKHYDLIRKETQVNV